MKDVYVVYGRIYWSESVIDHDGNYFGESNIYGIYESFESALEEFKDCVKEAHKFFAECVPVALDENLSKKVAKANPFENYSSRLDFSVDDDDDDDDDDFDDFDNILDNDSEEGGVEWFYDETENSAKWQMYPLDVDLLFFQCPILAGIYLKKQEIKP